MQVAAQELAPGSDKGEKAEKPEKKGNARLPKRRLTDGWGAPYGFDHPELRKCMDGLQKILLDIFDGTGPAQAPDLIDDHMRECGGVARYLDNQSNPRTSDGNLPDHKLYYYVLPCQAELAILVPPLIDLTGMTIALYVRCGSGRETDDQLVALLTVLSEDPVD